MFKLYKKDGSEVIFSTEEGMIKTLNDFPDKYSLIKSEKEKSEKMNTKKKSPKKEKSVNDLIVEDMTEEYQELAEVE